MILSFPTGMSGANSADRDQTTSTRSSLLIHLLEAYNIMESMVYNKIIRRLNRIVKSLMVTLTYS